MSPSVPSVGVPMPVATTSTPVAGTSPPNAAAAPATLAVDFMALLGQMTTATTPASTAMQPLKNAKDLETTEPELPSDVVGMMPLSMPVEVKPDAAAVQAGELLGVTAGLAKTQAESVAREAKLLTDLIQPELAPGAKPFEIPQLPAQEGTPVRQTSADAVLARAVQTPVGTPGWADDVGSRLTLMTEQGKHTASLRLSPEHLGPLEVRITMNDDKASVWFGAAHADTRAAIQDALPRLRELFASQGLSLSDANVSREPPRQQQPNPSSQSSSAGAFGGEAGVSAAPSTVRLGLFDAYA